MLRFRDSINLRGDFLLSLANSTFSARSYRLLAMAFTSLSTLYGCASQSVQNTSVEPILPPESTVTTVVKKPLPEGSLFDLLLAETATRRGELALATNLFAEQAQLLNSVELSKTAAQLANHIEDHDVALTAVEYWLTAEPDSRTAKELKAKTLIAAGNHHAAYAFIRNLAIDQTSLLVLLASDASKANKPDGTLLNTYTADAAKYPGDIGLLVGSGLLMQANKQVGALSYLSQARELAPNNTMVLGVHAAILAQHGETAAAVEALEHGLKVNEGHYGLKRQLGRTLAHIDIVMARTVFKDLLEQAPNDISVVYHLAQINLRLEFYDEAEANLKQLLQSPRYTDFANYNLGLIAERDEQLFIAMEHYHAVRSGPFLMVVLEHYANLARRLSDTAAFKRHLTDLERNNTKQALELAIFHTEFLLKIDAASSALYFVENALIRYGDDSKLLYGQFLAAEKQQNYELAVSSLRRILEQQPDNPIILNALGYTLSRYLNRHDDAWPLIQQALALKPNDAAIIDSMGWVLLKMGNIAEATEYLLKAYTQSTDVDIAAHLGEALWLADERDQALDIWRQAIEDDANNSELTDVLERFKVSLPTQ